MAGVTTHPSPIDSGAAGRQPNAGFPDDRGRRARESRHARAHLTLVQAYLRALRVAPALRPPARIQKPSS